MEIVEEHLGNKWFIVVSAYFAVLLPWAFMQKIDFISSSWKTVRRTRRNGLIQFWLTLIPITLMVPYIVLQARARDFKEMSAAILAFIFAFLHLLRTWWGLWQLRIFRDWAERSIRTLASQGVSYDPLMKVEDEKKLKDMSPNDRSAFLADLIQVNESVVDNQIMGGDTRCDIRLNISQESKKKLSKIGSTILSIIELFLKRLRSIARVIIHSFFVDRFLMWVDLTRVIIHSFFVDRFLMWVDLTRWFLQLEPREPTEVWVRWGTSFASQGLSKWIKEYNIVPNPVECAGDPASYENRKEYFAREVLTSALLLQDNAKETSGIIFGEGHPLRWEHSLEENIGDQEPSTFDSTGKVSQFQILKYALSTGKGLPFDNRHIRTDGHRERVSENLKVQGLKLYEFEVIKSARSMPAKFGNDINKFDYKKLESLTIMLNFGFWQSEIPESEGKKMDLKLDTDVLKESDHQINVLKRQIGISNSEPGITQEVDRSSSKIGEVSPSFVLGPLVVPTPQSEIRGEFGRNKNIVDVSAVIDIWHALNRGDSMKKIENVYIDKKDEIDHNRQLEKISLALEFENEKKSNYHLEQTTTFLGICIESLRSSFARNLEESMDTSTPVNWTPNIIFASRKKFEASECFKSALNCIIEDENKVTAFFEKRKTQIRIIWELQKNIITSINGSTGPQDNLAMICCLLSFPSLKFGEKIVNKFKSEDMKNQSVMDVDHQVCILEIHPVLAPQNFHIVLEIDIEKKKGRSVSVTFSPFLSKTGDTSDEKFDWQKWRNAFSGRMIGAREWKSEHDMEFSCECSTYTNISEGIVPVVHHQGSSKIEIKLWTGWLPLQPQICEFELEAGKKVSGDTMNYHRELLERVAKKCEENQKSEQATRFSIFGSPTMNQIVRDVLENLKKESTETTTSDRGLSILEVAASNGDQLAYENAMDTLCVKDADVKNLLRALYMTENFVRNRFRDAEDHEDVEGNTFESIEKWYLKLVKFSNYRASVVYSLSKFQRTVCCFQFHLTEEKMMRLLRKSYLRTQSSMILWEMMLFSSYCGRMRERNIDSTAENKRIPKFEWLFDATSNHFGRMFRTFISLHRYKQPSVEDRNLSFLALNMQEESVEDFLPLKKAFHKEIESEEKQMAIYIEEWEESKYAQKSVGISERLIEEKIELAKTKLVNFARALTSMHFGVNGKEAEDVYDLVIYHCQAIKNGGKSSIKSLEHILAQNRDGNDGIIIWVIQGLCYLIKCMDDEDVLLELAELTCANLQEWIETYSEDSICLFKFLEERFQERSKAGKLEFSSTIMVSQLSEIRRNVLSAGSIR